MFARIQTQNGDVCGVSMTLRSDELAEKIRVTFEKIRYVSSLGNRFGADRILKNLTCSSGSGKDQIQVTLRQKLDLGPFSLRGWKTKTRCCEFIYFSVFIKILRGN